MDFCKVFLLSILISYRKMREDMNEASSWRYALAQKIAPVYSENPKARLVEIGGSVARTCICQR